MKYRIVKYKIEQRMRAEKKAIVYTLTDPADNKIFYVGVTTYPFTRLGQHTKYFGFRPIMEEVETVTRGGWGYADIVEIEKYWIYQFKAWGFSLKNKYANNSSKQSIGLSLKQIKPRQQAS